MSDFVGMLRERSQNLWTTDSELRSNQLFKEAADRIAQLEAALRIARNDLQCLLDNDPDEPISDAGHTVIDLWRANAGETVELIRAALGEERT